jgi:exodeoxyribonuclease X
MAYIRVIDLETTGFEPPEHGVCEIGWSDVVSVGHDLLGAPTAWCVENGFGMLVNPGRPIPPETSAVHHIIDEDVSGSPDWIVAASHALYREDPPIAYAAHSAKFERQWCTDDLTGGVPWICTYKCALRLWPDAPSHSNQALRYWRRPDGLDREIAFHAHRAFPDAYVTAFHLRDMLALASIETLIEWSSEPALQVRCHIGKWRGTPWRDVDDGFLEWVAVRDFDEDVLFTVEHELSRRRQERAKEQLPTDDFEDADEGDY